MLVVLRGKERSGSIWHGGRRQRSRRDGGLVLQPSRLRVGRVGDSRRINQGRDGRGSACSVEGRRDGRCRDARRDKRFRLVEAAADRVVTLARARRSWCCRRRGDVGKVGVAVKGLCSDAEHAWRGRLRNRGRLLWLEYLGEVCGSCLRCGLLWWYIYSWLLVGGRWRSSLCLERRLGPPLARRGRCIGVPWLCDLASLPGLLLLCIGVLGLGLGAGLLANGASGGQSGCGRCGGCRGGCTSICCNTINAARCVHRGIVGRALLRRMRGRAQTAGRRRDLCGIHGSGKPKVCDGGTSVYVYSQRAKRYPEERKLGCGNFRRAGGSNGHAAGAAGWAEGLADSTPRRAF